MPIFFFDSLTCFETSKGQTLNFPASVSARRSSMPVLRAAEYDAVAAASALRLLCEGLAASGEGVDLVSLAKDAQLSRKTLMRSIELSCKLLTNVLNVSRSQGHEKQYGTCSSGWMLSNGYLIAAIGFDTADNDIFKIWDPKEASRWWIQFIRWWIHFIATYWT